MFRLANRIDDWLLQARDNRRARENSFWYYRTSIFRELLLWLHEWHAYEKNQQVGRNYAVRERNRLRRLEAEDDAPVAHEDLWAEGGLEATVPKKKRLTKRPKRWDFERKPGTSVGLILSRMFLVGFYSFVWFVLLVCLVFIALVALVICGSLGMTPFLSKKGGPAPNVAPNPPPKAPGDMPPPEKP
jgi:hypothetical protein